MTIWNNRAQIEVAEVRKHDLAIYMHESTISFSSE